MISGQFTSQARPWLNLTKPGPAALPCAASRTRSSEDIDIVKVRRASGFAVGALDADVQKGLASLHKGGCWFVAATVIVMILWQPVIATMWIMRQGQPGVKGDC